MAVTQPQRRLTGRNVAIVGVLLVLLAGVLGYVVVFHPGAPSAPARTVSVVVAAGEIPQSKQIEAKDVQIAKFAEDQVPGSALTDVSQAIGQYAAIFIHKNSPLTASTVVVTLSAAKAPAKPFLDIPSGEVALSIPSGGDLQNVRNAIQDGDHIDVMAWGLPGQKPASVAVVFTDLVVSLASAGAPPPSGSQQTATASSGVWIVFVPEKRAQELTYLFNSGQYKFILRSRKDFGTPNQAPPELQTGDFNSTYKIQ